MEGESPLLSWVRACTVRVRTARTAAVRRRLAAFEAARTEPWTAAEERLAVHSGTDTANRGRLELAAFMRCLHRLVRRLGQGQQPIYFRPRQQRTIEHFRNVFIMRMYGGATQVLTDLPYLAARWRVGQPDLNDFLIYIDGRRAGKSMLVALVFAVRMLTRGGEYYQFNMNAQQATNWLRYVIQFLMLMKTDREFHWTLNAHSKGETFEILSHWPAQAVRRVTVSGSGTNAHAAEQKRGLGNNAEGVNMDEGLMYAEGAYRTWFPILVNDVPCITTSTAPPSRNVSVAILDAKYEDTKTKVARVINARPLCHICADLERRINDPSKPVNCRHGGLEPTTSVRSTTSELKVKSLLQAIGGGGWEMEMRGIIAANRIEPVFEAAKIEATLGVDMPLVIDYASAVPEIFTTCDPGSRDRGSDTAIVTVTFTDAVITVPSPVAPVLHAAGGVRRHCTVRLPSCSSSAAHRAPSSPIPRGVTPRNRAPAAR